MCAEDRFEVSDGRGRAQLAFPVARPAAVRAWQADAEPSMREEEPLFGFSNLNDAASSIERGNCES